MAAQENENSYRKILKYTSVFGGVQFFQVLINLVRGKFIAIFLGPVGMGISSMFTSASNTIGGISTLGLRMSFVKETASSTGDPDRLGTIRYLSSLLIRITALLGALLCVILAPWLSNISFGNTDYAWQFALLGISVGLNVASEGKMGMLQGLHKVKILSMTSLVGALSGLLIGIPLYYFYGTKGIVPAMIALSIMVFAFSSFGLKKACPKPKISFNKVLHMPIIRAMVVMGMILFSASIINTLFTYLLNIFIRAFGDLDHVGLFNAANSITVQYTGVIFSAMAMDYFPRLSAVASDNQKMRMVVNRQSEIVALIAAPMAILLVATAPIVIRILLTAKFLPVTELMRWLGISILLKAIAYPLGYIAFAKDNKRLFFWLEAVACNLLFIGLSIPFYWGFGLMGLGYAAVIEQTCCIILYLAVNYKAYGFRLGKAAVRETIIAICFGAAGFAASILFTGAMVYVSTGIIFCVCAYRSFVVLRKLVKSNE